MDKQNFTSHISGRLNEALESLFQEVLAMGGLVEKQLDLAMAAMGDSDVQKAKRLIAMDKMVNEKEVYINQLAIKLLALQQPSASDLRLVLATIRIATDLERMGDETTKLGRLIIHFESKQYQSCNGFVGFKDLLVITTRSRVMLKDALNAFARFDVDGVLNLIEEEHEIDSIYKRACDDIVSAFKANSDQIECLLDIYGAMKASERLSDHTQNIMESLVYIVEGTDIRSMDAEAVANFLKTQNH